MAVVLVVVSFVDGRLLWLSFSFCAFAHVYCVLLFWCGYVVRLVGVSAFFVGTWASEAKASRWGFGVLRYCDFEGHGFGEFLCEILLSLNVV